MAFLNWRELEVKASVSPHPLRRSIMSLEIPAGAATALVAALEGVYSAKTGELRVELPNGWTIFWKEREGESRLLLAHPDSTTWIATAALTAEHGMAVLEGLRSGAVVVGEVGPVAAMSNVEIEVKAR